MNAEWKAKWLTALRGGVYQQGRQRLLRHEEGQPKFCCLGVLCDLYDSTKWVTPSPNRYDEEETIAYIINGESRVGILPEAVELAVGLHDRDGGRLVQMNDSGSSFAQIADFIEATL